MNDQVMNGEETAVEEAPAAAAVADAAAVTPEETPEASDARDAAAPAEEGGDGGGDEPRSASFGDLEAGEGEGPEPSLDVILNIPVTLSMEVGRTRMTIRELMELKRGSVVRFDRLAGEPMDVLVNGTLVAHGEVVVVNDKFGIRLTDVISPEERVRKLR